MSSGHSLLRLVAVTATTLALSIGGTALAAAEGGNGKPPDKPGKSTSKGSDTSKPQPPSKADYTGHGANVHGPYDSTRDGSPSQNGNGDGQAAGKPCAGCVGKADNKNPPGQLPGGSDANAGYECDSNSGIGKTNPAHTGCQVNNPPAVEPPAKQPPAVKPPAKQPPAGQPPTGAKPPAVLVPVKQRAAVERSAEQAELPTTGVDLWPILAAGLALVGAGGALLAAGRRRATGRTAVEKS